LGRDTEGGFRGIQSKSLMDLIQMECLSQSSTVLRVTRGPLMGRIWIQSGELIDAETDGVTGEAAFRRILEWKSGTFENLPAEPNHERTITKPANALLLEAAQAMDETTAVTKASITAEADSRKPTRRLAALTSAGAEYIVSVPKRKESRAEGWGTEAVEELAAWTRHAMDSCQHLAHVLQSGPLSEIEGRCAEQKVVVLPEDERAFLVAWPSNTKSNAVTEDSKKLVATWDS
jgi:hypothetical protein